MKKIRKILSRVVWVFIYAFVIVVVLKYVLQIFCFAHFRVPTASMLPAIAPHSRVIVNKMAYGARLFDPRNTVHSGDIYRFIGCSSPKRNDIMVFNNPYPKTDDSLTFDVLKYLVKRCVALPGDTFEIVNGIYSVRGITDTLGNMAEQKAVARYTRDSTTIAYYKINMKALEYEPQKHWTIRNFGPLYVPQKGDTITINDENRHLYRRIIEWETQSDTLPEMHIMHQNYYFVAGDNCLSSYDSRYWGLVPEEFIVGRVDWIL